MPAGYWPCQAVATNAISGLPAIDTGVTASLGMLHTHKGWNTDLLGSMGIAEEQMPMVVPMGEAAGTLPDSDAVITGGPSMPSATRSCRAPSTRATSW